MKPERSSSYKRLRAYLFLVLALAALIWSALAVYNRMQDHDRAPETVAPAQP